MSTKSVTNIGVMQFLTDILSSINKIPLHFSSTCTLNQLLWVFISVIWLFWTKSWECKITEHELFCYNFIEFKAVWKTKARVLYPRGLLPAILHEYLFLALKKLGIYSKHTHVPDWIFLPWISTDMKQQRFGGVVCLVVGGHTSYVLTGTEIYTLQKINISDKIPLVLYVHNYIENKNKVF